MLISFHAAAMQQIYRNVSSDGLMVVEKLLGVYLVIRTLGKVVKCPYPP